jgi:hypothetical protein
MAGKDDQSTTGARETGLWTSVSLVMLVVFFAGCACFTFADIFLGSNDEAAAIFAIVGVPLFLIGGVVLLRRSRLGPVPGPAPAQSSTNEYARTR